MGGGCCFHLNRDHHVCNIQRVVEKPVLALGLYSLSFSYFFSPHQRRARVVYWPQRLLHLPRPPVCHLKGCGKQRRRRRRREGGGVVLVVENAHAFPRMLHAEQTDLKSQGTKKEPYGYACFSHRLTGPDLEFSRCCCCCCCCCCGCRCCKSIKDAHKGNTPCLVIV